MQRAARRSSSPSPTREPRTARQFNQPQFLSACRELQTYADNIFAGTIIVGNGRSVLGASYGPVVDSFATVVRFNDYQISGYEEHIGRKTDLWVVSDWTCIKLLNKYPERTMPTLIAVPFKFMGKPYYHERRAEVRHGRRAHAHARCGAEQRPLASRPSRPSRPRL